MTLVTRPAFSMVLPAPASLPPWNESGIRTAGIPCIARTGHRPMQCPRGNGGRPSSKESSSSFLISSRIGTSAPEFVIKIDIVVIANR